MPTVILLDVSLSMSRPVVMPETTEEFQRRHLAIHGINAFLDYCAIHTKLEFVSLVVFSSLWEQLAGFSRDFDTIKAALNKVTDYDKTCIEVALTGAASVISNEWGVATPSQVILVTDGSCGVGPGSLQRSLQTLNQRQGDDDKFPLPFAFPSKIHVVCLTPQDDPGLTNACTMYRRLIEINGGGGDIYVPDGLLNLKSTQAMFMKMAETHFTPFAGLLKCGNLNCNIQVYPAINEYDRPHDFERVQRNVSETLEICGFLDIADIASPAAISRHLVLPVPGSDKSSQDKEGKGDGEEEEGEDGKTAAFTVLLHGSLKVEGMVALTQLAPDWFGIIYSWADSKKKSNLMLSVFTPGVDTIAWLGKIDMLAPSADFAENPYGDSDNKSPFPVRPPDRRSYAQNCVVWIKPASIQADVQKILRYARKLPEKRQNFYKDLNRLRKAALAFGFHELLQTLSMMLEYECTMLPGSAHADAALQLTHAANALRAETAHDVTHNIMPLLTLFAGDG